MPPARDPLKRVVGIIDRPIGINWFHLVARSNSGSERLILEGLKQISVFCPEGTAVRSRNKRRVHAPRLGTLSVLFLCGLELLDWWIPSSSIYSVNDASRLIPHVCRTALMIWFAIIVARNYKDLLHIKFLRVQAAWLCVVVLRYAVNANGNSQAFVYAAIYMFAPLALWAVYCLVLTNRLSLRAISSIGTIMTLIYIARILAYKFVGLWLGADSILGDVSSVDLTYRVQGYWVLLFVSMALVGPFRYRKLIFAMTAITIAGLCMERSVQIGGMLGLLALFAVEQRVEPRKRVGLACILICAALALSLVYYLNSQSIVERWSDINDSGAAGSGRAIFWLILIGTWWQGGTVAHLFGFGPLSVYATTDAEYLAGLTHAHNEWIQMLYECGIVGLVAYTALIISLCAICIRLVRSRAIGAPAVCFITVVVLCHGMFDFFLSNTSALWYYIVLGSVLGTAELGSAPAAKVVKKKTWSLAGRHRPWIPISNDKD